MSACIPLTIDQAKLIMNNFTGAQAVRNRALFALGCATGMRITELLCLQLGDIVTPDGKFRSKIKMTDNMYKRVQTLNAPKPTVSVKNKIKTKKHSGEIGVRPFCHKYLLDLLHELEGNGYQQPNDYLFITSTGKILKRWSMYWAIRHAAERCGIYQTVGTHSMRKTFAMDLFFLVEKASKDNPKIKPMISMMTALRHSKYDSTLAYMKFIDTNLDPFYEADSFDL